MGLRSIKRPSKYVLISTCLLLVLAGEGAAQIVAEPTISVQVNVTLNLPSNVLFDVLVNGIPFCIIADPAIGHAFPKTLPKTTPQQISIPLVGTEYFGTCGALGSPVGPFTGTITLDSPGPNLQFTVVLDFTVGPGGVMNFHSESEFTGDVLLSQNTCNLENVASPFAFVTGTSFNFNLQLLEVLQGGACSFGTPDGTAFIDLPTFVFTTSSLAVGGMVMPVSTIALLAPWMVVIGLVGCIAVAVAMKRRDSKQQSSKA